VELDEARTRGQTFLKAFDHKPSLNLSFVEMQFKHEIGILDGVSRRPVIRQQLAPVRKALLCSHRSRKSAQSASAKETAHMHTIF
jgi:hypothetical protein